MKETDLQLDGVVRETNRVDTTRRGSIEIIQLNAEWVQMFFGMLFMTVCYSYKTKTIVV